MGWGEESFSCLNYTGLCLSNKTFNFQLNLALGDHHISNLVKLGVQVSIKKGGKRKKEKNGSDAIKYLEFVNRIEIE